MGVVYEAEDLTPGSSCRVEVPAARSHRNPQAPERFRPRGAHGLGAQSSEHLPIHKSGRSKASRSSRWSCFRASRSMPTCSTIADDDGDRQHRDRDCRRSRCGAPRRHHPSRYQAGKHLHHQPRRAEDSRLRSGEDARGRSVEAGRPPGQRGATPVAPEHLTSPGHRGGHGGLHVARNRRAVRRSTRAAICFRSARCFIRWSPAGRRSRARRRR